MFKAGKKVLCDVGSGTRVGFILDGPNGEESKYNVQVGDQIYPLTYREPADRDARGAGMTFWSVS